MSEQLRGRIQQELDALVLVDPHTHINPHAPAAATLADILGYHYYTELAHSAGMPRHEIEEPGLDPKEKVRRLVPWLAALKNTVQVSWLLELARELFNFSDPEITPENWETLYDHAETAMAQPDWAQQVLAKSNLRALLLTNDFDDPLEGFDTQVYIPCLRTDDLVFHLARPTVTERLEAAARASISSVATLRSAVGTVFQHFVDRNAKACAISLPPDFVPEPVGTEQGERALQAVLLKREGADAEARHTTSRLVFWMLAEFCAELKLPFDLMIGVNRGVYAGGVYQGQDLFDGRLSLIQYKALLNAFPQVVFPISVLSSGLNQELVSYAWIFPNVVTSGHWWYSNTPTTIEQDAAARLEAVPATKQIGYYSDMYKLEFALPKFGMYRRVLSKVLAERMVIDRGWTEEQAVELGRQVLKTNVERIFGV